MRRVLLTICFTTLMLATASVAVRAEETIVFFRHGEKPSGGLGQLTCQGLNRALALPSVLIGRFGTPAYLYAPNPAVKMSDPGGSFFYVRPLATIEPTAIRAGRSVNTGYGYNDVVGLQKVLVNSSKANSTIFVSWETRLPGEGRAEPHQRLRGWPDGAGVDQWRLRQPLHRASHLHERRDQRRLRAGQRRAQRLADQLSAVECAVPPDGGTA